MSFKGEKLNCHIDPNEPQPKKILITLEIDLPEKPGKKFRSVDLEWHAKGYRQEKNAHGLVIKLEDIQLETEVIKVKHA